MPEVAVTASVCFEWFMTLLGHGQSGVFIGQSGVRAFAAATGVLGVRAKKV